MPHPDRVLVLSDGGLPSLAACAASSQAFSQSSDAPAAVYPVLWEHAAADIRLAAVARQAELLALPCLPRPVLQSPPTSRGLLQTTTLLDATFAGAAGGFPTILWPIHAGPAPEPDLDSVGLAIDRALLVSRLAALDAADHGCPSIRIDTPYADFTDRQLAELALDLGVPIHACWWWGGQGGSAAAERQRWTAALQSCGWAPV